MPVRLVSAEELRAVFERLGLWDQIRDGTLSTTIVRSTWARNLRYAGGTSNILVHHNEAGVHICTTHRITDTNGNVLHWDEQDAKLDGETVAKE